MALIVEDGTNVAGANAYISLAYADSYIGVMPPAVRAPWEALTDPDKENIIVYATRVLDQRTRWNGQKAVNDSALRWPRTYVFDADHLPVADSIVPERVKDATAELCAWFSVDGRNPNTISDSQGIQAFSVDVISVTYKADHDASAILALPRGLNTILRGLGVIQAGNRPSFGAIQKV